jgi:hypothetical protein
MKKLLTLTLVFFFCLSFASAFEFDNWKNYNSETKEVTVTNAFNLGDDIAKIKLNTPLNNRVARGYNKVAEFEISAFDDYNNAFKELELFDKNKGMEKFERNFDYKVRNYETIIVDDYETICEDIFNVQNNSNETSCEQVFIGTHEEQIEKWTKLTPADFKKDDILTIGIFTEVEKGDVVEWIPNMFGVRIDEWAVWTEELNVDLISYYKLDEQDVTGSGTILDSLGINDGTNVGASNTSGIINTGYSFITDDYIDLGTGLGNMGNLTISIWFKANSDYTTSQTIIGNNGVSSAGSNYNINFGRTNNEFEFIHDGSIIAISSVSLSDDNWHNLVVVRNGSAGDWDINWYFDGSFDETDNTAVNPVSPAEGITTLGRIGNFSAHYLNGALDEFALWNRTLNASEISDLWNDGNGISWTDAFLNVTLNSPVDRLNSSSQNIEFNCSATDETGVLNLSLIIDDSLNFTVINSSSGENLSLVETINSITEGNHNWTCIGCDADSCETPSARDIFIDSLAPQVEFTSPANNSNHTDALVILNISIVEASPDTCIWSSNSFSTNNTITCGNNITEYWEQGTNVVNFWMNDTSGGNNRTSITFNVDSLNLISPVDNFESDNFEVEFNCNFSLIDMKNVSLLTNVSGDLIPNQTTPVVHRYGDEYYLTIEADNIIDISALEINNVIVTNISDRLWKLNTTNADDEVSRALVIKTLFYGTDGSDPRINSTFITNPVEILSPDARDNGKRGVYSTLSANPRDGGFISYNGTFTETTSNENISIWSYAQSNTDGSSAHTTRIQFPIGTTVNEAVCGSSCGITNDETGTDTSADEQDNPNDISIRLNGLDVGGSGIGRVIILTNSNVTWIKTQSGNVQSITFNNTDFTDEFSIPLITYEGEQNFINEFWNITITEPTLWSCQACDVNDDCFLATENRTVLLNLTSPTINLDEPRGQIDSFVIGGNLTINWTVSNDDTENCWFEYNSINTSVTCAANNFSFTPVINFQNLTFYANDSIGNQASNFTSWTYNFIENNATFNATSQETATESFILNMTTDIDILSISGILDYNGTEYISNTSCVNRDCIISNTIDISLVESGESELHNFFWNFTIFNGTGSNEVITSTRTQNVSRIHLEQCNATYTTKTLNFTTFDEQNLSRISPFSFNGFFEFWIGSGTIKRNNSFSKNITEMNLCLQPNATMKIDATIDYNEFSNASLYTSRFYYFDGFSINNILQNIAMYLLKSTESTSFILKVQDENLLPVADALIEIHRFYPGEGEFRIVQIAKTDDNGKSIGFFQTETVDYKFVIKKDGETLLETGQQKVIPETSPFTLTFNTGEDLGEPWESQNEISNLDSTLVWDSDSGIVTYTYVDSSNNFTQARLLVQKQSLTNSTAYTTICNDTSSLSSSAITCNVGNTTGFYIASSFITRTGEGLDLQINFQIEDFSSIAGLAGLFYGFFLIVIASFMFKFNEVAGIWAVTMTVFLVNILGLIKFGSVFVSAIFGIAIILTWTMER